MQLLKSLIREVLLTERVFGSQAFVYHGSSTPPDEMLDILVNDKFDPGRGSGDLYGKGLYTVYEENVRAQTFNGNYGRYVYKLKVSLHGFIIFDADICQKVYGKILSPYQQLELLGETEAIEFLEKYSSSDPNRHDSLLQISKYVPRVSDNEVYRNITSKDALKLKHLTEFVKGIVFTGVHDGKVALIYDPQATVPVAWSESGEKIQWQKWSREEIRPALQRSAAGKFQTGKFSLIKKLKTGILDTDQLKVAAKVMKSIPGVRSITEYDSSVEINAADNVAVFIMDNSTVKWFKDDHLHRLDGPAIEYPAGEFDPNSGARGEWFIGGNQYEEDEFDEEIEEMKANGTFPV
jgi:hypothetical protein